MGINNWTFHRNAGILSLYERSSRRETKTPAKPGAASSPPRRGERPSLPEVSGVLRCKRPAPGPLRTPEGALRRRRRGQWTVQALWRQPPDFLHPAGEVHPFGHGGSSPRKAWAQEPVEVDPRGRDLRASRTPRRYSLVRPDSGGTNSRPVRLLGSQKNPGEVAAPAALKKKLHPGWLMPARDPLKPDSLPMPRANATSFCAAHSSPAARWSRVISRTACCRVVCGVCSNAPALPGTSSRFFHRHVGAGASYPTVRTQRWQVYSAGSECTTMALGPI